MHEILCFYLGGLAASLVYGTATVWTYYGQRPMLHWNRWKWALWAGAVFLWPAGALSYLALAAYLEIRTYCEERKESSWT